MNESKFSLNHLPKGVYRLISFEDKNKNMVYDSETEKVGFVNEFIDTSNKLRKFIINLFKATPKYKINEVNATGYGEVIFSFHSISPNIKIESLDKKINTEIVHQLNDSIYYWFNPEVEQLEKNYTFRFKVTNLDLNKTDTIKCIYPKQSKPELIVSFAKNVLTPEDKMKLITNTPISKINKEKIFIYKIIEKDTLAIPFTIKQENSNKKQVTLDFTPELNSAYLVNIFPKGIEDIYGNSNKEIISKNIIPSKLQNYGTVKLQLLNEPHFPFFLELYDEKNNLVQKEYLEATNHFKFNYLTSGKYILKLLVDENRNKQWDTGDFYLGKQPEKIYTYDKKIEARALWDIQEQWILPID